MGLRNLRRNLQRFKRYGWTWKTIGLVCHRSEGWACAVARRRQTPPDYVVAEVGERLWREIRLYPFLCWNNAPELDTLVLILLRTEGGRLTGGQLARLCGTTDRTIRKSVKRLRDYGYSIDGSMRPPRGYRLGDHAIDA